MVRGLLLAGNVNHLQSYLSARFRVECAEPLLSKTTSLTLTELHEHICKLKRFTFDANAKLLPNQPQFAVKTALNKHLHFIIREAANFVTF